MTKKEKEKGMPEKEYGYSIMFTEWYVRELEIDEWLRKNVKRKSFAIKDIVEGTSYSYEQVRECIVKHHSFGYVAKEERTKKGQIYVTTEKFKTKRKEKKSWRYPHNILYYLGQV